MKDADGSVGARILPPEAVDDEAPAREGGGIVLPVIGMILAVVAAWLVLTMMGVLDQDASAATADAAPVIRTSSCC